MKKYEFTGEEKTLENGVVVKRIKAVRSFVEVEAGMIGGWIESEENLSHDGFCWVGEEAIVYGNAVVCEDAMVEGHAVVRGDSILGGRAYIFGHAVVGEEVVITEHGCACDSAVVENTVVEGTEMVKEEVIETTSSTSTTVVDKTLVFDMDGTIADFYGVKGWLQCLLNEDEMPYREAKPLYNPRNLNLVLEILKLYGWKIVVTTWLAKNSSESFTQKVTIAKLKWLEKYGFPYDEINICRYGTDKKEFTPNKEGSVRILIDDNEKVRKEWTIGESFDANKNVLEYLLNLIKKEHKEM